MPMGKLALNAWLRYQTNCLFEEDPWRQMSPACFEDCYASCRLSLADPITMEVYHVCLTVLSVLYDRMAVTDLIYS